MRRGHEQIGSLAERMQRRAVDEARAAISEQVRKEVETSTRRLRELEERLKKIMAERPTPVVICTDSRASTSSYGPIFSIGLAIARMPCRH